MPTFRIRRDSSFLHRHCSFTHWIPACAGMTEAAGASFPPVNHLDSRSGPSGLRKQDLWAQFQGRRALVGKSPGPLGLNATDQMPPSVRVFAGRELVRVALPCRVETWVR